MFPDAVKAEMYQRVPRDGWKGYGNEVNRNDPPEEGDAG
jgi:N6-adenosine-specific RNA methylase IME4